MPSSSTYQLAILLSLKDAASGGLDRFEDRLRATGKEGRQLLKTVQDLRKDIKSGLTMAGIGVTTLAVLKKGVDAASEYEAAMLDLKSAYQEVATAGGLSADAQAAQLNKLETLATRLGNNLQGNTQQYVGILTALRQAGVETETVLGGAGEAAANLANVSGALLRGMEREQAKELGQFAKLFQLKPEDFGTSVDLFSALKDRFDIDSSALIESSKYFSTTAQKLDQRGIGGASDVSKFFALLKRQGALEGSQAGTSSTSFFQQFIAHADKVKKLKKELGIDLQLFDPKTHQFKGWENAFQQMEKLRALKGEKQLAVLNEIFGEQGGKVAGIMVEAGAEGWRNVTTEAKKAVSVQEKINQQMETYNAKWEALEGTLTNLKASVFGPMLDVLKPILDVTNSVLGGFQEWAKTHPEISRLVTTTAGLTGVLLTITGGIKAARAAWNLYKITSAIALGSAQGQASGLLDRLTSLRTVAKAGLVLGIASFTAERIYAKYLELEEVRVQQKEAARGALDITKRVAPAPPPAPTPSPTPNPGGWNLWEQLESSKAPKRIGRDMSPDAIRERLKPENTWKERALIDWKNLTGDYSLQYATDRTTMPWYQRINPWRAMPGAAPMESWTGGFDVARVAKGLPRTLEHPGVLAAFRKILSERQSSGEITAQTRTNTEAALELRFPQAFEQSTQMLRQSTEALGQQFNQLSTNVQQAQEAWAVLAAFAGITQPTLDNLIPTIQQADDTFKNLQYNSSNLPTLFQRMGNAAENFANRVNNLDLSTSITWPSSLPGSQASGQQPAPLPGPRLTTPQPAPLLGPRRQASYDVDEIKTEHGTADSATPDVRLTVAPATLQQLAGLRSQPQAPFSPASPVSVTVSGARQEGEKPSPFLAGLESLRAPNRAEELKQPAYTVSVIQPPPTTPTFQTVVLQAPVAPKASESSGAPTVLAALPSGFLAGLESLRAPSAAPTAPTMPPLRVVETEPGPPRAASVVVNTQAPADFLARLESSRTRGGEERAAGSTTALPIAATLQSESTPLPPEILRASLGGRSGGVHVETININVPAGAPAAQDPQALAALVKDQLEELAASGGQDDAWFVSKLHQHSSEIERVYVRFKGSGRERAGHG